MVNYLAVLVATIVAFVVGALWYGPFFGKPWKRLMGMNEGMQGSMPVWPMVGGFIATLVMVYVLALLMKGLLITSGAQAAWLAFVLAIAFIGTIMLNGVLY